MFSNAHNIIIMVAGTMEIAGRHKSAGDNSSSYSSCKTREKEERMEGSLWSKLPEELLLSILARLQLDTLARLEQVCRDWKSLWQNRAFLHLRSEVEAVSCNSWFIFQHRPFTSAVAVDCYNTHSNKWHELRFDHLPPIKQVCAGSGSLLLCVGRISIYRPSAIEQNNMMHYPRPSYKFLDMIVCNPLKPNSWERIPERLGSYIPHVGMVADAHTGNYKVMLASLEKTEIYDSRQKSWKSFDNFLSHLHDVCSSPVEYRGRLLFLGVGANGQGRVFVYNLEHNTCSSFDTHFLRNPFPRFVYLENCGGRLLMVRLTTFSPAEILGLKDMQRRGDNRFEWNFELQVCEYLHTADDLSDGVWRELTSIPILELERSMSVNSKEGANFLADAAATSSTSSSGASLSSSFAAPNDLFCFTMGMKDGKLDCSNRVEEKAIFLYSLSQNLWCFVGERPQRAPQGVICTRSLQFQPSLHSSFVP